MKEKHTKRRFILDTDKNIAIETESIGRVTGVQRQQPHYEYALRFGHDGLDMTDVARLVTIDSPLSAVSLTDVQKRLYMRWNLSKLSYYQYIQRRVLIASPLMGHRFSSQLRSALSAQSSKSKDSRLEHSYEMGEYSVYGMLTDGVYMGPSSYSAMLNNQVSKVAFMLKLLYATFESLPADTRSQIDTAIELYKTKGELAIDVNASGGVYSPFVNAVFVFAERFRELLNAVKAHNKFKNNHSIDGAIYTLLQVLERGSGVIDDTTVLPKKISNSVAASYSRFADAAKNDASTDVKTIMEWFENVFSADLGFPVLSDNQVLSGATAEYLMGAYNPKQTLPFVRRGNFSPVGMIQRLCYYYTFVHDGHVDGYLNGILGDADRQQFKFKYKDGKIKEETAMGVSSIVIDESVIWDNYHELVKGWYDYASGSETEIRATLVAKGLSQSKNVPRFASIVGANRAKTVAYYLAQDDAVSHVLNENNVPKVGVSVIDSAVLPGVIVLSKANQSKDPSSFAIDILGTMIQLTQQTIQMMEGTGDQKDLYGTTIKGHPDINRNTSSVERALQNALIQGRVFLDNVTKTVEDLDNYRPSYYEDARRAFKSLISTLQSTADAATAQELIQAFLVSDAFMASLAGKMYALKNSLDLTADRVEEFDFLSKSSDVVLHLYNRYVTPVSFHRAEFAADRGSKLRSAMGIKDINLVLDNRKTLDNNDPVVKPYVIAEGLNDITQNYKFQDVSKVRLLLASKGALRAMRLGGLKLLSAIASRKQVAPEYNFMKIVVPGELPGVVKDQAQAVLAVIDSFLQVEYENIKKSYYYKLSYNALYKFARLYELERIARTLQSDVFGFGSVIKDGLPRLIEINKDIAFLLSKCGYDPSLINAMEALKLDDTHEHLIGPSTLVLPVDSTDKESLKRRFDEFLSHDVHWFTPSVLRDIEKWIQDYKYQLDSYERPEYHDGRSIVEVAEAIVQDSQMMRGFKSIDVQPASREENLKDLMGLISQKLTVDYTSPLGYYYPNGYLTSYAYKVVPSPTGDYLSWELVDTSTVDVLNHSKSFESTIDHSVGQDRVAAVFSAFAEEYKDELSLNEIGKLWELKRTRLTSQRYHHQLFTWSASMQNPLSLRLSKDSTEFVGINSEDLLVKFLHQLGFDPSTVYSVDTVRGLLASIHFMQEMAAFGTVLNLTLEGNRILNSLDDRTCRLSDCIVLDDNAISDQGFLVSMRLWHEPSMLTRFSDDAAVRLVRDANSVSLFHRIADNGVIDLTSHVGSELLITSTKLVEEEEGSKYGLTDSQMKLSDVTMIIGDLFEPLLK